MADLYTSKYEGLRTFSCQNSSSKIDYTRPPSSSLFGSYLGGKSPPRPCVCVNKKPTQKPGFLSNTPNCGSKAPCHLANFFQKMRWEKFKEKNFPAKNPVKAWYLKLPVK